MGWKKTTPLFRCVFCFKGSKNQGELRQWSSDFFSLHEISEPLIITNKLLFSYTCYYVSTVFMPPPNLCLDYLFTVGIDCHFTK